MLSNATNVVLTLFFIVSKAQTQQLSLQEQIFGTPPTKATSSPTLPCKCVPYYMCLNGTINTNGKGFITPRVGASRSLLGRCSSNYFDVCCNLSQISTSVIKPTPPPQPRPGCGQHYPNGKAFKVVGNQKNQAQYSEFPWMVIVLEENNFNGKLLKAKSYKCGGALIHTKVVLTAGHCVVNKAKYTVSAGDWDTRNSKEIFPNQDREVEHVIIHPNYIHEPPINDIALLVLQTPVNIAENVNLVCLPDKGALFDNTNCFATGWGKTFYGIKSNYVDILKKISLPIVPRNLCEKIFRTTRLGEYFILDPSNICAGGNPDEDTCEGDGGSPLVCPVPGKKDTYQQAGIVSWGLRCGDPVPAAYVNVAMFREWIDTTMINQGLNTTSYQA